MAESTWVSEVLEREALRHDRDQLRDHMAKLIGESAVFGGQVAQLIGQRVVTNEQVRAAVLKVIGSNHQLRVDNIRLAHRVDQAEAEAATVREQLAEVLRQP